MERANEPKVMPTDDELNVAICLWRGWKLLPTGVPGSNYWNKGPLPSHVNGIEALGNLHEAEKGLTGAEHKEFRMQLWEITTGGNNDGYEKVYDELRRAFVSPDARQRAIALLKVVRPEMFK